MSEATILSICLLAFGVACATLITIAILSSGNTHNDE